MIKKLMIIPLLTAGIFCSLYAFKNNPSTGRQIHPPGTDADNAGLKLPSGFGALVVADSIGKARHIVVTKEGNLYVKLAKPVKEKGIIYLQDKNGDGRMDEQNGFGNYGGTGLYLKDGVLYASSNDEVFSYQLNEKNEVLDQNNPAKLITKLKKGRQHDTKSIVLDNSGNIYVNIGAYSNSCQQKDRTPGSPGIKGCPILDSAGGIWQFKVNKLDQSYGDGVRYATGIRNVVGLDWNQQNNTLFVMQHGRDQLNGLWPDLYDEKTSALLPAECLYMIKKGDNAGWPYVYYDQYQKKNIQAPEYGGDGKKEGSKEYINPALAFPGHLAPNGLLFYTGNQFPEKYRNGAFIAFHGSWNRTPEKQEGFYVVFAPFKDGMPTGEWEIFADGFAGTDQVMSPRDAKHRPCGLAQGPDGSLYVTDDVKGTIYRILYNGK